MAQLKQKRSGPVKKGGEESSKERLRKLMKHIPDLGPEGFDPAEVSWVTDLIGITAFDGVEDAVKQGCVVINVADEIRNDAQVRIPVDPYSGSVLKGLNEIADTIQDISGQKGQKVVVHCAMGMERSVLAVVWYLHRENGLSIDDSYDVVRQARPVAVDRREWIFS